MNKKLHFLLFCLAVIVIIYLCKDKLIEPYGGSSGLMGSLLEPFGNQIVIHPDNASFEPQETTFSVLTYDSDLGSGVTQVSTCSDDSSWRNGDKTCRDYSLDGTNCEDIGDDGRLAFDACKVACDNCNTYTEVKRRLPRQPSPVEDTDEPSYAQFEGSSGDFGSIGGVDIREILGKLEELSGKIDLVISGGTSVGDRDSIGNGEDGSTNPCSLEDVVAPTGGALGTKCGGGGSLAHGDSCNMTCNDETVPTNQPLCTNGVLSSLTATCISVVPDQVTTCSEDPCGIDATCTVNDDGSGYTCSCDAGFYGDDTTNTGASCTEKTCDATDASNTPADCGDNATCSESVTENGYICTCDSGYTGTPTANGPATCILTNPGEEQTPSCIRPTDTSMTDAYNFTGARETLTMDDDFSVSNITCNTGYGPGGSNISATVCNEADTAYTLTGCEKTGFCKGNAPGIKDVDCGDNPQKPDGTVGRTVEDCCTPPTCDDVCTDGYTLKTPSPTLVLDQAANSVNCCKKTGFCKGNKEGENDIPCIGFYEDKVDSDGKPIAIVGQTFNNCCEYNSGRRFLVWFVALAVFSGYILFKGNGIQERTLFDKAFIILSVISSGLIILSDTIPRWIIHRNSGKWITADPQDLRWPSFVDFSTAASFILWLASGVLMYYGKENYTMAIIICVALVIIIPVFLNLT
jgi:hypothetical protein